MTKMTVPLKMTAPLTALVFLASTVVPPASPEILYAESAPMSFEAWAADLRPGFVLREKTINDRLCYCKKPEFSTSSTSSPFGGGSFSMNKPPPLTSSGVPGSSFEFIFITPDADQASVKPVAPSNNNSSTVLVRTTTPGTTAEGTTTPQATTSQPDTIPPQVSTDWPTTTSTSTSTSTSTTTEAPTTTTTTTTTCGNCNMDVIFDATNHNQQYVWTSPGWNEGKRYPDGCSCRLTVKVDLPGWAMYQYDFTPGSEIKSINNCAYDRLDVNLDGKIDRWCDVRLEAENGFKYTNNGGFFEYIFTSDPLDNNQVARGFELTVKVMKFRH